MKLQVYNTVVRMKPKYASIIWNADVKKDVKKL